MGGPDKFSSPTSNNCTLLGAATNIVYDDRNLYMSVRPSAPPPLPGVFVVEPPKRQINVSQVKSSLNLSSNTLHSTYIGQHTIGDVSGIQDTHLLNQTRFNNNSIHPNEFQTSALDLFEYSLDSDEKDFNCLQPIIQRADDSLLPAEENIYHTLQPVPHNSFDLPQSSEAKVYQQLQPMIHSNLSMGVKRGDGPKPYQLLKGTPVVDSLSHKRVMKISQDLSSSCPSNILLKKATEQISSDTSHNPSNYADSKLYQQLRQPLNKTASMNFQAKEKIFSNMVPVDNFQRTGQTFAKQVNERTQEIDQRLIANQDRINTFNQYENLKNTKHFQDDTDLINPHVPFSNHLNDTHNLKNQQKLQNKFVPIPPEKGFQSNKPKVYLELRNPSIRQQVQANQRYGQQSAISNQYCNTNSGYEQFKQNIHHTQQIQLPFKKNENKLTQLKLPGPYEFNLAQNSSETYKLPKILYPNEYTTSPERTQQSSFHLNTESLLPSTTTNTPFDSRPTVSVSPMKPTKALLSLPKAPVCYGDSTVGNPGEYQNSKMSTSSLCIKTESSDSNKSNSAPSSSNSRLQELLISTRVVDVRILNTKEQRNEKSTINKFKRKRESDDLNQSIVQKRCSSIYKLAHNHENTSFDYSINTFHNKDLSVKNSQITISKQKVSPSHVQNITPQNNNYTSKIYSSLNSCEGNQVFVEKSNYFPAQINSAVPQNVAHNFQDSIKYINNNDCETVRQLNPLYDTFNENPNYLPPQAKTTTQNCESKCQQNENKASVEVYETSNKRIKVNKVFREKANNLITNLQNNGCQNNSQSPQEKINRTTFENNESGFITSNEKLIYSHNHVQSFATEIIENLEGNKGNKLDKDSKAMGKFESVSETQDKTSINVKQLTSQEENFKNTNGTRSNNLKFNDTLQTTFNNVEPIVHQKRPHSVDSVNKYETINLKTKTTSSGSNDQCYVTANFLSNSLPIVVPDTDHSHEFVEDNARASSEEELNCNQITDSLIKILQDKSKHLHPAQINKSNNIKINQSVTCNDSTDIIQNQIKKTVLGQNNVNFVNELHININDDLKTSKEEILSNTEFIESCAKNGVLEILQLPKSDTFSNNNFQENDVLATTPTSTDFLKSEKNPRTTIIPENLVRKYKKRKYLNKVYDSHELPIKTKDNSNLNSEEKLPTSPKILKRLNGNTASSPFNVMEQTLGKRAVKRIDYKILNGGDDEEDNIKRKKRKYHKSVKRKNHYKIKEIQSTGLLKFKIKTLNSTSASEEPEQRKKRKYTKRAVTMKNNLDMELNKEQHVSYKIHQNIQEENVRLNNNTECSQEKSGLAVEKYEFIDPLEKGLISDNDDEEDVFLGFDTSHDEDETILGFDFSPAIEDVNLVSSLLLQMDPPPSLQCPHCPRIFSLHHDLVDHVKWHSSGSRSHLQHVCTVCLRGFSSQVKLDKHIKWNHEGGKCFSCPICPKRFTTKTYVKKHVETIHKKACDIRFYCDTCEEHFATDDLLKIHEDKTHKAILHQCEKCLKYFEKLSNLQKHKLIHSAFPCVQCGQQFSSPELLHAHGPVHQRKKRFKCEMCNSMFTTANSLKRHKYLHSKEKLFRCEICQTSFHLLSVLKTHLRIHIGARRFECRLCHKTFNRRDILNAHQWTHTGEKKYQCDICKERFRWRHAFRSHKLIYHATERPHVCQICGKKFSHPASFKKHVETHSEKLYYCQICLKAFSRFNALKSHLIYHKPFMCDICNKRFRYKSHLKGHFLVHTKEKTWLCKFCNKTYKDCHQLRRHKRLVHHKVFSKKALFRTSEDNRTIEYLENNTEAGNVVKEDTDSSGKNNLE